MTEIVNGIECGSLSGIERETETESGIGCESLGGSGIVSKTETETEGGSEIASKNETEGGSDGGSPGSLAAEETAVLCSDAYLVEFQVVSLAPLV